MTTEEILRRLKELQADWASSAAGCGDLGEPEESSGWRRGLDDCQDELGYLIKEIEGKDV